MVRKNPASDEDRRITELVEKYELLKQQNMPIYMEGDQLADIANIYANERKFDEAQEVITHGLNIHPTDTDLMLQQAYLYLDLNKRDKALQVAELITDATDSDVILLKTELALHEGKLDEAEKLLDTLSEEEKNECDILTAVCYLYLEMGYPDIAIEWLGKGMELYKDEEEFVVAAADCYASVGKNEQAIFLYNKAIDKHPYNARYWVSIAQCHLMEKEYGKALEAVDFALAADESYNNALIVKAHCLGSMGNHDEAKKLFKQAFENSDLPPEMARFFAGISLMEEENWVEAIKHFKKTIKAVISEEGEDSQMLVDLYNNLGICYAKQGKFAEAHKLLKKSEKLAPDNCETYLAHGRIYMEEGRWEEGEEIWQKAISCERTVDTFELIAQYSMEFELVSINAFCYEQIKELEPDYPDIDRRLAMTYLAMGDHENFHKYNRLSGYKIDLNTILKEMEEIKEEDDPGVTQAVENFKKFILEHGDSENKNLN